MTSSRNTITIFTFVSLTLAIVAWALVVFFALHVQKMLDDRAGILQNSAQRIAKHATAARVHALAQETLGDRTALSTSVNVDVLSAVSRIESIGAASGVKLQVSDAVAEKTIPSPGGIANVNQVGLVVQATGSYAGLMRAFAMLETLPLATSIEAFDIARAPIDTTTPNASAQEPWHLNVRLRLLTTANLSS